GLLTNSGIYLHIGCVCFCVYSLCTFLCLSHRHHKCSPLGCGSLRERMINETATSNSCATPRLILGALLPQSASHSQEKSSISDSAKNSAAAAIAASIIAIMMKRGVTNSAIELFARPSRGFIPSRGSTFPYKRGTRYRVGSKENNVPETI